MNTEVWRKEPNVRLGKFMSENDSTYSYSDDHGNRHVTSKTNAILKQDADDTDVVVVAKQILYNTVPVKPVTKASDDACLEVMDRAFKRLRSLDLKSDSKKSGSVQKTVGDALDLLKNYTVHSHTNESTRQRLISDAQDILNDLA